MNEQLYSAEEAAQILGLQVRTVRNYLRDGRLPGVRIGKQYRIARSTLDAFAGTGSAPAIQAEVTVQPHQPLPAIEVSSVVQVNQIDAAGVDRITRTLMAATVSRAEDAPMLRVEPLYNPELRTLKVIVVGSVADAAELIQLVGTMARESPAR
jgi:excisionase family DNA binding protein